MHLLCAGLLSVGTSYRILCTERSRGGDNPSYAGPSVLESCTEGSWYKSTCILQTVVRAKFTAAAFASRLLCLSRASSRLSSNSAIWVLLGLVLFALSLRWPGELAELAEVGPVVGSVLVDVGLVLGLEPECAKSTLELGLAVPGLTAVPVPGLPTVWEGLVARTATKVKCAAGRWNRRHVWREREREVDVIVEEGKVEEGRSSMV